MLLTQSPSIQLIEKLKNICVERQDDRVDKILHPCSRIRLTKTTQSDMRERD